MKCQQKHERRGRLLGHGRKILLYLLLWLSYCKKKRGGAFLAVWILQEKKGGLFLAVWILQETKRLGLGVRGGLFVAVWVLQETKALALGVRGSLFLAVWILQEKRGDQYRTE